ncbi:recombinase family protein [Paenibacillus sediminis]|uniref:DNA invertase Pin-like site-specific DNA recombinase n=1 Tax=Paenibacillus sediminis TaxID=664909 RepID=A0ABS4H833_9BACL|nr:recombinase family protein [Paenibacillus sediminis]MBP1938693.1 DNA invertase Pin-like site-specific DNA recombinase [Paenibacillus sediminis]
MNVLIILRGHHEESTEDQLEQCHAYTRSKQWHVTNVRIQEGDEGSLPSLEDDLHQIDVVLATDLSRIALSLFVFKRFLNMLEKHNIRLFTVKDGEIVDFSC